MFFEKTVKSYRYTLELAKFSTFLENSSETKPSGLPYFEVADFGGVLSFDCLHYIFEKFVNLTKFCMVGTKISGSIF